MAIIWSKKYSVGFDEIDNQHKVLVDLINKLEDIYENRNNYKDFEGMLDKVMVELKNYTILHFSTEEVLMQMFTYGDFETHKQSHDHFISLISEQRNIILQLIKEKQGKDEKTVERHNKEIYQRVEKITDFLQKWLLNHIMKSDFEYIEFFTKLQKKAQKSGGWLNFLKS